MHTLTSLEVIACWCLRWISGCSNLLQMMEFSGLF